MKMALLHFGSELAVLLQNIAPQKPDFADRFTKLIGWILWGCQMVCVVGIAAIGTMLAVSIRRGETGEHASRLGAAGAGVIVVGLASTIVNALIK
jgi:hypothetical protein